MAFSTPAHALTNLLKLVWLMVPAYCANMAPPFTRFWRGWNRPIHRRLLGEHKTVLGFALGVAAAIAAAWLQSRAAALVPLMWHPDQWPIIGAICGVGALLGDAIKSFFKRRRGYAPGARWVPADQLDFAIAALLGLATIVPLTVGDVVLVLAFTFAADIAVNHIAFRIGIRESAW